jgi:hypothetical protein
MRTPQQKITLAVKAVILLQGLVAGMFAAASDFNLVEGIISAVLALLLLPILIVLVIRANIALGFLQPPWDAPHLASNPISQKDPLPFIQFASFYFASAGVGAAVSIVWKGAAAVPWALVGLCGGIGCHLGLLRLLASFPAHVSDESCSRNGSD